MVDRCRGKTKRGQKKKCRFVSQDGLVDALALTYSHARSSVVSGVDEGRLPFELNGGGGRRWRSAINNVDDGQGIDGLSVSRLVSRSDG